MIFVGLAIMIVSEDATLAHVEPFWSWRGAGGWGESGGSGGSAKCMRPALPPVPMVLSVAAGALMVASPYLVLPAVARYLAAPVWLGFIFLLDPINARLGGNSLFADL